MHAFYEAHYYAARWQFADVGNKCCPHFNWDVGIRQITLTNIYHKVRLGYAKLWSKSTENATNTIKNAHGRSSVKHTKNAHSAGGLPAPIG